MPTRAPDLSEGTRLYNRHKVSPKTDQSGVAICGTPFGVAGPGCANAFGFALEQLRQNFEDFRKRLVECAGAAR